MSSISASLRELQEHSFSDQDFSDPFFHPVNIFWDPEGKTFNKEWLPLWKRSLLLGWSLIKASFQYDAKWSKEEFWKQFENLRKEVKANLFAKEPLESSPVRPSEISTEDEAIHSILMRILKKWQTGIDAEKEGPMETVLLSSRNLKETPPPSFMGEKEIPPDTVMIVPPKTDLASKEKGTGKEMDRLAFSRESDASLQEDDFSAETVILGSGKDVSSLSRKTPSKDLRLEKEAFPSEEAKREATPKTQEKPSDDDFLAETIFLVPQKAKPKGKNGKKG